MTAINDKFAEILKTVPSLDKIMKQMEIKFKSFGGWIDSKEPKLAKFKLSN